MTKEIYITTAIDYPNSEPHLGTAYEKIGADILVRYLKMSGHSVHLQMGNDEHSIKVKRRAEELNLEALEYCQQMKDKFVEAWQKLNIDFDDFIQTSEPRHQVAAQAIYKKIQAQGDIYKRSYEGWYCEGCEAFYTDRDLEDGECPSHRSKPKWLKEENYFFKLSKYQVAIQKLIEEQPQFILPEIRRNEVKAFLESGLEDISISRPQSDWGVPVPDDPEHCLYVWFDALINYLAALGFAENNEDYLQKWPADLHVIGKDITRFHCVIWPAMLLSAGILLPKAVFGHGFVYFKGERMSKTLGNIVSPLDVVDQYGADALRYYLMRESSFGSDSDFTWEGFIKRYNSDLANDLGNVVSRTLGMIDKYFEGLIEPVELAELAAGTTLLAEDQDLLSRVSPVFESLQKYMNYQNGDLNFHQALAAIWTLIADCDKYIDRVAPWQLKKEENIERLQSVMLTLLKMIVAIATLVRPFLPASAQKIFTQINVPEQTSFAALLSDSIIALPHQVGKREVIFPRIQT